MDVLVDDGVVLGVDDDVVADGGGRSDGHGGADGRQRVICCGGGGGGGLLLVVVAGRGHEHDRGRRVPTAAGLVRQHPIAFVRAGTAGTRAERPPARLVVRVEQVRVDVVVAAAAAARVHVGRHRVQMMVMMMVVMAVCTVHQRLRRFLQTRNNVLFITTVPRL